ncbi:hypothetical protein B0H14DRAFT_3458198 [Mycena olivaceomarginata]|nr:hypothetical protein B0H14DRAFT_3458198 [Mycena olivaceomarginata]
MRSLPEIMVEAQAERDAFIANLIEHGLPDYITPSGDFGENMDRCRAHEAFRHYVRPRYLKFLRARVRRYQRLKYKYELASADLVESDGNWGGSWGDSWILSQETDNISPLIIPKCLPFM